MINPEGKGKGGAARAGTEALRLLSTPIDAQMLLALASGPKSALDLRRRAGSPPQTTMRGHLRELTATGLVRRRGGEGEPGLELTGSGRELLGVAAVLQAWLATSPQGPLELGSGAAKSAIRALVDGWGTSIVRALAVRPLSLTQLNGLIDGLSYPALERRLGAMRLAGQLQPRPGPGRGTPYAVTRWLRGAIAPLGAAARWERAHSDARAMPIRRLDVEAAFLLIAPLLRPPADVEGSCRLAVELGRGERRLAGIVIGVRAGRVRSCTANLGRAADAWVSGPAGEWLRAVIERDSGKLEIGGDGTLAEALLEEFSGTLFGQLQSR